MRASQGRRRCESRWQHYHYTKVPWRDSAWMAPWPHTSPLPLGSRLGDPLTRCLSGQHFRRSSPCWNISIFVFSCLHKHRLHRTICYLSLFSALTEYSTGSATAVIYSTLQSRTWSIPVWQSCEQEVFHSLTHASLCSSPYPSPYWVVHWYRMSKCTLSGQLPMRCCNDDCDLHSSPIQIIVGSGTSGKALCKFQGRATITQCSVLSTWWWALPIPQPCQAVPA